MDGMPGMTGPPTGVATRPMRPLRTDCWPGRLHLRTCRFIDGAWWRTTLGPAAHEASSFFNIGQPGVGGLVIRSARIRPGDSGDGSLAQGLRYPQAPGV